MIQILDCTLRDGGYVNDWCFGDSNARQIVFLLSQVGIDYVEVGFIKNCVYENNRIQFNDMSQVATMFRPTSQKLSIIVEVGYGYPIEAFPQRSENTVDLVRVVMWKRSLKEGLEYCKRLIDLGYEVSIQPTRIEQYSYRDFENLVKTFSTICPKAIYIVDTFGLLTEESLICYGNIVDGLISNDTYLGYHAHNNMQQALSNAQAFIKHDWVHNIMLDASVWGMGRGAGNLQLELILYYLNSILGMNYNINPIDKISDLLKEYYEKTPWGYRISYYLSAICGRNPMYVNYLEGKGITYSQMALIFQTMKKRNIGIIYDTSVCDALISELI